MFDDDSDLTDIDDSSAGTPNLGKVKKSGSTKVKGSNGSYKIKNALKPPRTTSYTAKSLYDQLYDGDIDLNAEYQRDVVWPEAKQIGIIDSMFRNFYVPPIIFAVITNDDGSERRICIDGKQRLTSIQKFMDGVIPHKDSQSSDKLWFKDTPHRKTRDKLLPEGYANLFRNKQVVCVEYMDLTTDNEREIFQRVQMGMALSTAEKMQAISGPWPDLIRSLERKYLVDDGLTGDNLDWDRSRGRQFQVLAQCIFTIDKYPNTASGGTTMQIDKWLKLKDTPDADLIDKIYDTFDVFLELVRDDRYNSAFKKPTRVAPIELVMITVLIAAHKPRFSLAKLSNAIAKMRKHVREEHVDIRSNAKVAKTFMDFIKELKPSTIPGDGEPAGTKVGGKRKRVVEDEDTNMETSRQQPPGTVSTRWDENPYNRVSRSGHLSQKSPISPNSPHYPFSGTVSSHQPGFPLPTPPASAQAVPATHGDRLAHLRTAKAQEPMVPQFAEAKLLQSQPAPSQQAPSRFSNHSEDGIENRLMGMDGMDSRQHRAHSNNLQTGYTWPPVGGLPPRPSSSNLPPRAPASLRKVSGDYQRDSMPVPLSHPYPFMKKSDSHQWGQIEVAEAGREMRGIGIIAEV